MYEANIKVEAIISYKWLADQNFVVHPRRHGLYFQDEHIQVFIPGIEKEEKERSHCGRFFFTRFLQKCWSKKHERGVFGSQLETPET